MKRTDVLHHVFLEKYIQALRRAGVKNSMGFEFPAWTPYVAPKQMNKVQLLVAMMSITAPGVYSFEKGVRFIC